MGIVSRFFRKKGLQSVNSGSGGWHSMMIGEPFAGAWQENKELRREDLLSFHAVFTCVSLISGDVGKLPFNLTKLNEGIEETTQDKRFAFLKKPNQFQTWQQFIESWIISKLTRGNTYVFKFRDLFGEIIALHILNPDFVKPLVDDYGNVFYQISADRLAQIDINNTVPASEIIHDRFNCFYHPLVGLSPLIACGLAAGKGLAIEKNSSSFFGNMSRPSGILVAPGPIDSIKAGEIRTSWNTNYSAGNYGKTAILGDGLTYQALSVTAADAQVIEQLKMSVLTVCGVFHVPPFKGGFGDLPSGGKVSDLNEIYYSDCLQIHIEAIENLLIEDLDLESFGYSVSFDLSGLIRMDSGSQMTYLKDGVGAGLIAPNEGRRKINLPPVVGGESPMVQQQNYSLAALAKRDAKDDPFAKSPTSNTGLSGDPQGESKMLGDLIARVKQLENRPVMEYQGVYDAEKQYDEGDVVTHGGSMWHCNKAHTGEFSNEAFTLCVKKGRDARVSE